MSEPITIEEARRRVLDSVRPLPDEQVPLDEALGRVLAEDVESELDVPPFRSSAMDGFAIAAGAAGELSLAGESRAGRPAAGPLETGTAVRISTGAALPEGADAVIPLERAEPLAGALVRIPAAVPGENVRLEGEDVRAGDTVLRSGTVIGPAELGVAASVGRSRLRCALRPRAALVVTGDELTEPGKPLAPGRIYSSNEYALAALLARAGAEVSERTTAPDSAAATVAALRRGIERADVLCVSGGISVGEHDHVRRALAQLGVEERFWGVRLRPGKPTWFGTRGEQLAFGLPGNPVSAMVTFQLFVRPALLAVQGADPAPRTATARLDAALERHPRRTQGVRVRLRPGPDGLLARSTGAQGSHVLTSMLGADALALVPAGEGELAAGDPLEVELL